jgi:predicted Zn-dependent protease
MTQSATQSAPQAAIRALRRLFAPLLAPLVAVSLLAGCAVPPSDGPSTGAGARAEADQSARLLAELRRRDMLIEDARLNRYVAGMASRIEPHRPRGAPRVRTFIVKDAEVNAFTSGAGYVFLHAGLLAAMENEAQFAMVLAHEIAHVDRGHVSQGMRQRQNVGLGATALAIGGALAGVPQQVTELAVGLGAQAVVASYTREQETEADLVGFGYLTAAGWNGAEGARSFEVMRKLYGERSGVAQFFASHPQSTERQAQLTRMARQQGADRGRVARPEWLRETSEIRRATLQVYEAQGRNAEARHVRGLLRAR